MRTFPDKLKKRLYTLRIIVSYHRPFQMGLSEFFYNCIKIQSQTKSMKNFVMELKMRRIHVEWDSENVF